MSLDFFGHLYTFLESSLNLDFAKTQSSFQYFHSVLLVNNLSVLFLFFYPALLN